MGFLGKKKIINITIKDHVVRFVELKQSHPPIISRYGEHSLPKGIIHDGRIQDLETFETILEECVKDWKVAKRQVRFVVPESLIMLRKITVPNDIKEDEITGYLFMEIGESIHLPFENPIFDYALLPREKNGQELLLFAGPEEIIQEYADVLEEVKLEPICADISSLSLYRLYHQQRPEDQDTIMLVQIDLLSVNLCIFQAHKPVVARHLFMDVDQDKWVCSTGSDKLDHYEGDQEEVFLPFKDVFLEIDRVRNFYNYSLHSGKKLVNKIIVSGDHPWLSEVCRRLAQQIDIPIEIMNCPSIVTHTGEPIDPAFYLNIGLGLKEVE